MENSSAQQTFRLLLQMNDYFKQKFAPKFPLTIFIGLFQLWGIIFRSIGSTVQRAVLPTPSQIFRPNSTKKLKLLAKNSFQVRGASNKK
jgi:hypothetical protein